MVRAHRFSGALPVALAVAAVVTVAGCSSGSSTSTSAGGHGSASGAPSSSSATRIIPPDAIKSAGEIVIAMSAAPPYDQLDPASGAWTGIDVRLLDAAAALMGVKAKYVTTQFAAEIPGLAAHRFDLAPNIGDFVERRSSATFIDYAHSQLTVEVLASGAFQPKSILELCGHTVGYEAGTAGGKAASAALATQCPQAGKPAATWQGFPNRAALELALRSQRIQGLAAPVSGNDASAAASGGQFKNLTVEGLNAVPGTTAIYGMAVASDSPLAQPLLQAMQVLVRNGSYQQAFEQYHLPGGELPATDIKINGSTLHKAG